MRDRLQNSGDIQKASSLSTRQTVSAIDVDRVCIKCEIFTDTKSAIPTRTGSPAPTKENAAYEMMAPTGVDALNTARCFLHSTRGNDVDKRDVVNAREVGARV